MERAYRPGRSCFRELKQFKSRIVFLKKKQTKKITRKMLLRIIKKRISKIVFFRVQIPRDALRSERGPGSAGGRGGDSPFYKDEHCISRDPRGGREEKEEGGERERECRQGEDGEEQRPRFVWMEEVETFLSFFLFFSFYAQSFCVQTEQVTQRLSLWKTTGIL